MKRRISYIQNFLEKIDSYRDGILFLFIKPHWPLIITPNHISYFRAAIGLALFILLFFFGVTEHALVLSLFFVGVFTDFIDGPVARGTNRVTEFGAALDPVADRILLIPVAVYALFLHHKWLLLALFLTEIFSAVISLYYRSREVYLESNIFGKVKMVLMSIAFIAILVSWPNEPSGAFLSLLWLSIPASLLASLARMLELREKKYAKTENI